MRARKRGVSHIIAVVLTILIAVLASVSLYFAVRRMTGGTNALFADLSVTGYRWVGNTPTYTLDLTLQSKAKTRLYLKTITFNVIGKDSQGNVKTETIKFSYDAQNKVWTSSATGAQLIVNGTMTPNTQIVIEPGQTLHIAFTFIGDANNGVATSIGAQITMVDDAGNTYTVQSNSATVG